MPPLKSSNVYAHRLDVEKRLKQAMQRHLVPIVYGDYGAGKTSVVRRFLLPEEKAGHLVYLPSASEITMADVFRACLEHLDYRVEVHRETSTTDRAHVGINLKFFSAGGELQDGDSTTTELAVKSPTDARLIRILSDAGIYLVIDELHNASNEFTQDLATFIKASRTDADGLQLILIGTGSDARQLVRLDPGIDRYLKDTLVPLFSEAESKAIIQDGFDKLDIQVPTEVREALWLASVGAPTIVQELCLNVAEAATDSEPRVATKAHLDAAIADYLESHESRMSAKYISAIETFGSRRTRKQILHAVANTPSDYATMEDIRSRVSAALGIDVPSTALSGPLGRLKSADFGHILKDVDRVVGGTRVYNLSTFTDPMMKSFVRFAANLEKTGHSIS